MNLSEEEYSSRHQASESAFFSEKDDQLLLSGQDLVGLVRTVFNKGLPFRFWAGGASMYPFIKNGDIITLSPLSGNLPRLGDVVAYVSPETERFIVHRVIKKIDDAFLISGDALRGSDGVIPKASILGYVTRVERNGRRPFLGLGPERLMIAFLIRRQLLKPILRYVRFLIYFMVRR